MAGMSIASGTYNWLDDDGPAFGGPGLEPRWTSSRKDAVATAYAASSKVWYTMSHGTLNEIYYPTIDRPQTRDMELLFTDEESFFHEEKRDLTYDFEYVDPKALAVRVSATDAGNRYKVTKEFVSDPHHPVVLVNVKIEGDEAVLSRLKCLCAAGPASERRWWRAIVRGRCKSPEHVASWHGKIASRSALARAAGSAAPVAGYVGKSDGYQDLAAHMRNGMAFRTGAGWQSRLDGRNRSRAESRVHHRDCTGAWSSLRHRRHDANAGDAVPRASRTLYQSVAPRCGAGPTGGRIDRRWRPDAHLAKRDSHARGQDLLRSVHRVRFYTLGRG